jgi:hypothetical protein
MKLSKSLLAYYRFTILVFLLIIGLFADAQNVEDSVFMEQSKLNAIRQFKLVLNENALIYSGNEYIEYVPIESLSQILKGTPFFQQDSLVAGSINFDGVIYTLPIKLQLIEQRVIINHPVSQTLIELPNERVQFFTIGSHFFYKTPIALSSLMNSDKLYAEKISLGHFDLWIIHEKLLKYSKKAEDQSANYISYNKYAIQKKGIWQKIKSEKDLYDFCIDKKEDVQNFARNVGLNFNKDFEASTVQVLKYYDSILK